MIVTREHSVGGSDGRPIAIDITSSSAQSDDPVIIFVHGFKGFKDWGAHHLVAQYFAAHGFRYLKFNLSHSGISPDNPKDITDLEAFGANTFSKELHDIDLIIDYALESLGVTEIYLIGHSRGGGLSIIEAARNNHVKALITWSAIADFASLWKKDQEDEWKKNGKIYVVNARTKQELPLNFTLLADYATNNVKLDILGAAEKINIPWLIIHGDDDTNVPFETAEKLAQSNPHSQLLKIEGGNHVYGASHPYEIETLPAELLEVCAKSLAFLKEVLRR